MFQNINSWILMFRTAVRYKATVCRDVFAKTQTPLRPKYKPSIASFQRDSSMDSSEYLQMSYFQALVDLEFTENHRLKNWPRAACASEAHGWMR
jgi:hypothetical protein